MNIKIRISAFLFLISMQTSVFAQSPQFVWAKQFGGNWPTYSKSIATDAIGNVYTTGYFYQTVDFDPGVGEANLTALDSNGDLFISKLNSNGNYIWAKKIGGNGNLGDRANSINIDEFGNVYITGVFSGTGDFDPGVGVSELTSSGEDIFIIKLDTNGNFVWAKNIGGSSTDRGLSIAVDNLGNVYTTGFFHGTVDFDPGVGTSNMTSTGLSDIFVLKLDANGNFIWAKNMGGSVYDYGQSIAVDASGNVYFTGYFNGTADFDPGAAAYNFTSKGYADVFISKLDTDGNFVWAKQIGGVLYEIGNELTVDTIGNVLITGYFNDTVDFDPGAGVSNLTSFGSTDIFILKLNSDGNYIWAKQIGGGAEDMSLSLDVDDSGNVYTTGYFWGIADFDPGVGVFNLTPIARRDCFISILNADGDFVWAHNFGSIYEDDGYSIDVDANGNVFTTGGFYQTVDFDPGVGAFNLSSGNIYNMFILKLHFQTLGINNFDLHYKLLAYPNPSLNGFEIDFNNIVDNGTLKVLDIQGKELYQKIIRNLSKVTIELNQPAGLYFLDIRTPDGQKIIKLIKE